MHKTTIIVLGANGQLGQTLQNWPSFQRTADSWKYFTSSQVDITQKPHIDKLFEKYNITYIINCAAYTSVDGAETDKKKARQVNAIAVKYLAQACQTHNSTLIHISTDFVFDGCYNRPLKEDDPPHPLSVYGQTKLEGEESIKKYLGNHFILRTGWLYSGYGHNFFRTMQGLAKTKNSIKVVYDQIGTPTHTKVLVEIIQNIIERSSTNYGLYHAANEGVASWYDFAFEIIGAFSSTCKVAPILSKDYPTTAKRPAYSVLDKSKLKAQFQIDLPHWKTSLQRYTYEKF